ncbi:MAG: ferredoxin [Gemmobacter sp.]|uniref:ferredoxin n=1 Tax=Gemmobacter sp. TaxID=1898957 RepID=UPI001A41AD6E|nr:ferredoxin [Gemmobacter sp.]MBL8560677.1 ferredoxin [Gemmobacter sp.]
MKAALEAHHLEILGGFHAEDDPALPKGARTLLLIGPSEPGFWPHFTAQPEWQDGQPDPMDRWSRRVIGRLACDLGAKALFPFGGPPYHPFYQWALRSGRAWASPVQLLVHETQGLFFSARGALALKERVELPAPGARPCDACAQPCADACPAGALTPAAYNVSECHSFLDSGAGEGCLSQGCAVRRACPVSQSYARMEVQSAYHMRQFHR